MLFYGKVYSYKIGYGSIRSFSTFQIIINRKIKFKQSICGELFPTSVYVFGEETTRCISILDDVRFYTTVLRKNLEEMINF